MFLSHLRAGTGIVFCETRDESALLHMVRSEVNGREMAIHTAPNGALLPIGPRGAIDGEPLIPSGNGGFGKSLAWAGSGYGNRILVVLDAGTLANSPGIWRQLLDSLPRLRNRQNTLPSLVIMSAPTWQLTNENPMRGIFPILSQRPPNREQLADILGKIGSAPDLPDDGSVLDALAGLPGCVAEQTASESLIENKMAWNTGHLRSARESALRDAGLTVLPPMPEIGGLTGITSFVRDEVIPWKNDSQLAVRRVLCAGLPGTGKSYFAQHLGAQLQCETVELSIPRLKAGIVGASETNLRRALETAQSLAESAPLVLVLDEVDKIASEGLDGGTSSGMFSQLLTFLQRDRSRIICVACLNSLAKIDAALQDRFATQFFFDLPNPTDRQAIALIHLQALGAADPAATSAQIASCTEGFSAREIAEKLCPSLLRQTSRAPNGDDVIRVARSILPTSQSQEGQVKAMRDAGAGMARAAGAPAKLTADGRSLG